MKRYLFLLIAVCMIFSAGVLAAPTAVGGEENDGALLPVAPEDIATAEDLIVAAARLHSLYNGAGITESSDYEACYSYAVDNGIIFEGLFEDNGDEINKAELCYVLFKVIPEDKLTKINDAFTMPDADPSSEYYKSALALMNAGIIEGIDSYGALGPGHLVKRYELSDVLSRITNEDERIVKDYIEYASDEPFFLIDDYLMGDTTSVRGIYNIASGWRYDYTGSVSKAPTYSSMTYTDETRKGYVNTLRDLTTEDNITISREIFPQKDGELVLETSFHITFGFAGMIMQFEDIDGNQIFEMGTESLSRYSNYLYFISNGTKSRRYLSMTYSGTYAYDPKYNLYADKWRTNDSGDTNYRISDQIRMRLTFNLDKDTVKVEIGGTSYGTYKLNNGYNGFAKVVFTTGIKEQIEYTVKQVHLYKNYRVNDRMRVDKVGSRPAGYTTSGSVIVSEIKTDADNQGDFYSAKITAYEGMNSYANKVFEDIGGKVKLETYLLIPDGNDNVYFNVGCAGINLLKIITKDGKFYVQNADGTLGTELRFFTPNVWQCIRIEADTATQTALIKINGKVAAENVPFLAKANAFDFVRIGIDAKENCIVWFDDVEVHGLFEHEDYVPEPTPLDTGDYILSMSVCNLWRNGSHYGWEYIAPHAEIEPITSYYDEGSAEAMDWEIKFLAEHGISTYAMCWYSPTDAATDPIKKPRMIDAHHEGYFNAKYTEYLDFSIMWENAGYGTPGASEGFKTNVFPYWMDWYFSDDRYFRIEEDGKEYLLLTIYQWARFRNMCLPAKDGAYTSNVDSYYNASEFFMAEEAAKELIAWMEQQVIDAGYADGIILCFTNNASNTNGNNSMVHMAGTDTAVFPYAWGSNAYDLDVQMQMIETNYEIGQKSNLDLLAMAAVGFNDVGWAQRRYPLISNENFGKLLRWLRDDYMPRYKNDEDSWKQHFIQFDTWNEYGEGHYIYPTVGLDAIPGTEYEGYGGYGHLEEIAKAFGKNYNAALHEEIDIIPTDNQKSRLRHLYVGNRMFIRREFLPDSMKDTPIPEEETVSLKFNSASSVSQITGVSGFYNSPVYNASERAVVLTSKPATGTQSNPDPIIHFEEKSKFNGLHTSDCSVIHIRMKTTKAGSPAQVFFRVTTMPKNTSGKTYYSEDYQYTFYLKEAGVWHDYYIDTKSHDGFTGYIETIRFDPGNLADNTIYLSEFEFLKFSKEQKRTEIVIDGIPYTPTDYWEEQETTKNEIYLAPTDDNNFYKLTHIVYDWNEKTGVLFLDTPNGTTFEFNVGSDKVLINGETEETLEKTFYVYDGAPVLPILYIFDKANINYIHDFENKTLDVTVANHVTFEAVNNSNAEGEDGKAFYSFDNPDVSIVVDKEDSSNHVWYVPGTDRTKSYIGTDVSFVAGKTYTICLDVKLDSLANFPYMGSEYDLYYDAIYDDGSGEATSHTGKISKIYYTGKWAHVECDFTVADTRVENKDVVEKIAVYFPPDGVYGINYYIDNMKLVSRPMTFVIHNGDAEDEDMSMWYASNTYCNRVWDDEMNSWVIELTPHEDSSSAWSYLRQKTKFEAGVTYYFSYDAKMGVDTFGTPVTTSFAINFRFNDLLQSHFTSNVNDHSITNYGVSQSDGWKHYSGSFTVSEGRTDSGVSGGYDEITWYVNPLKVDGVYSPMTIRFDNIKFSTTPLD